MEETSRWKIIAWLKIGVIFSLGLVIVLLFVWQKKAASLERSRSAFGNLINQTDSAILTIPYQQTLYKHFGQVVDPKIKLQVKTISGYKQVEFLLDSGAVVSALPQTMAAELGVNLEELPRITIEGFAGSKTFAYKGEFVIKVGREETIIPVVFSENPNSSNILGRIGFFDQFSISFDANSQNILITKKK
jgi:hypothetical protein